jgi:nitrite reductase/ring-hydroxylating ferredoxin subunit
MYNWCQVEEFKPDDFMEGKMYQILLAGKAIGLVKQQGRIFAFSAVCPHAGASLCEGWLDARGNIVCPLHSYRFDPANGRNTSGEGYKLRTYPVDIKDDSIFIGLFAGS